jgi:UDP-N-acetyl-D-galactosamine dehydrogenase
MNACSMSGRFPHPSDKPCLTRKKNCLDFRNSRFVYLVRSLREFRSNMELYDPFVEPATAGEENSLNLVDTR